MMQYSKLVNRKLTDLSKTLIFVKEQQAKSAAQSKFSKRLETI